MTLDEKVRIARVLDALGVDVIEAGFPVSSPHQAEAVRAVAEAVRRPVVAALARAVEPDLRAAFDALAGAERPRIHTFIATSDIHLAAKFDAPRYGRTLAEKRKTILRMAVEAVAAARSVTDDVEFSAEDAGRTDAGYLCEVFAAVVDAGATTLNIPDTTGFCLPHEVAALFATVGACVPGVAGGRDRALGALPRRPRPRPRQQPRRHRRGRAAGRVHAQRHRRAGGQRGARRDRDGDSDARRSARRAHEHRPRRPLRRLAPRLRRHRLPGSAQQSHRRAQRLRPRGGHPPARRAQEPGDVRDHERRRGRAGPRGGHPARQAFGPCGPLRPPRPARRVRRRRAALRPRHRRARSCRCALRPLRGARRPQERTLRHRSSPPPPRPHHHVSRVHARLPDPAPARRNRIRPCAARHRHRSTSTTPTRHAPRAAPATAPSRPSTPPSTPPPTSRTSSSPTTSARSPRAPMRSAK